MVFYRTYRPQLIQELDSKKVRETLFSVLSSKTTAHAFLFTGSKGLGKTSAARIVAKAVNCERLASSKLASSSKEKKLNAKRFELNADIEPCNKCQQCISITNGTNLDVLEIDGASNRGIDEIRDLREKIRLSPVSAQKKVYIIDEVHMLTTEAFNALLKTLEEPPEHALFILCTTEPHKVPETIVSRCFHISFTYASSDELIQSFKRVIKGEKLEIDNEDTLTYIARLSDGSFRDGTKILEELAAKSRGKITKKLVEEIFHVSNIQIILNDLFEFLSRKDTESGLKVVQKLVEQGIDLKYSIEQVINQLHAFLLIRLGIGNYTVIDKENAKLFSIDEIKSLVELFTKAHSELKYAVVPQLPLELVIIEWGGFARGPVASFPPASAPLTSSKLRVVGNPSTGTTPRSKDTSSFASGQPPSLHDLESLWKELISKVKSHNHSMAGVLRGCTLDTFNGKEMTIETGFKFHKDRLSEKKNILLLEEALKEITGNLVHISVQLKSKGGD